MAPPFPCRFCVKTFPTQQGASKHMSSLHKEELEPKKATKKSGQKRKISQTIGESESEDNEPVKTRKKARRRILSESEEGSAVRVVGLTPQQTLKRCPKPFVLSSTTTKVYTGHLRMDLIFVPDPPSSPEPEEEDVDDNDEDDDAVLIIEQDCNVGGDNSPETEAPPETVATKMVHHKPSPSKAKTTQRTQSGRGLGVPGWDLRTQQPQQQDQQQLQQHHQSNLHVPRQGPPPIPPPPPPQQQQQQQQQQHPSFQNYYESPPNISLQGMGAHLPYQHDQYGAGPSRHSYQDAYENPGKLKMPAELSRNHNTIKFGRTINHIYSLFYCIASALCPQNLNQFAKQLMEEWQSFFAWQTQCLLIRSDDFDCISKLSQWTHVKIHLYSATSFDFKDFKFQTKFIPDPIEAETHIVSFPAVSPFFYVAIRNPEKLHANIYPELCLYCGGFFARPEVLTVHQKSCRYYRFYMENGTYSTDEILMKRVYRQGKYKPKETLWSYLRMLGLDTNLFAFKKYFIVWDCESILKQVGRGDFITDTTIATHVHECLAIAVGSNVPGFDRTQVLLRTKGGKNSLETMVRKFVDYIIEIAKKSESEFLSNPRIRKLFAEIEEIIETTESNGNRKWNHIANKAKKKLSDYCQSIPALAFNCSSYDLPLLKHGGLFAILQEVEGNVSLVKKGSQYLMVKTPYLRFLDILRFQGGKISLRNYVKAYNPKGSPEDKSYFPYRLLRKVEDINGPLPRFEDFDNDDLTKMNLLNTQEFRTYERLFESTGNRSEEKTLELMGISQRPQSPTELFEELKKMWRDTGCNDLKSVLCSYARKDVDCLIPTIIKWTGIFHGRHIDVINQYISLPSLSLPTMLSHPAAKYKNYHLLDEENSKLLEKHLVGGASIIFKRLSVRGETKIKEYTYGNKAKTTQRIMGLDANGLYAHCLKMNSPSGPYVARRIEDGFQYRVLGRKNQSLEWIAFEGFKRNIEFQTILNAGEKSVWITDPERKDKKLHYFVDGFASGNTEKGEKDLVLEFNGCGYSHGYCPSCRDDHDQKAVHPQLQSTFEELQLKSDRKIAALRFNGFEVIEMWSCEWESLKRNESEVRNFTATLELESVPKLKENLTQTEIIDYIMSGDLQGFFLVDVFTPAYLWPKFSEFPPLFRHIEVGLSDLSPEMREYAVKHELISEKGSRKGLTPTFNGRQVLLSSDYIKWLIDHGINVQNCQYFLQYKFARSLAPYIDEIQGERKKATLEGNAVLANVCKNLLNSAYGFSLHRKDKNGASKVKLVDKVGYERALTNSNFIKATPVGLPSSPGDMIEVVYQPRSVTLDQPLALGFQVLQMAKIHLLSFYHDFLRKYLRDDMFENLSSDTDSIYIALAANTMRECVKVNMLDEFDRVSKEILVTPEIPESKFTLGNFKLEMEGTRMVCLTSKCYVIEDEDTGNQKASSKGVSKTVNADMITFERYRQILEDGFEDSEGQCVLPFVRNPMITQNRGGDKIFTIQSMKKGLTSLETKRYYYPDLNHSRPHLFL